MVSYSKLSALGAFALIGASVAGAGAIPLKGSDTLEHLTNTIIASCPGVTAATTYVGGGSSSGEQALSSAQQEVAPMSRFLQAARTCAGPTAGAEAAGYAHSLDAIAIVQSRREGAPGECDTNGDGVCAEACPSGADPAYYGCKTRQNEDQECIAVAYTNRRTKDGNDACDVDADCQAGGTRLDRFCTFEVPSSQRPNPTRGVCAKKRFFNVKERNGVAGLQCPGCVNLDSDTALEYELNSWSDALAILWGGRHHNADASRDNCNSDVRHTLAQEWTSFSRSSCTSQRCEQIHHVFRRSDLSGTTDTFLGLVGLKSMPTASEAARAFPNNPFCNGSDFEDLDPVRRTCLPDEEVCRADGTLGLVLPIFVPEGLSGGTIYRRTTCQTGNFASAPAPGGGSVLAPRDSSNAFGCLNEASNSLSGEDGRSHNLVLRNANGSIVLDANGRELRGSFYRIHSTKTPVLAGDEDVCRRDTATVQIGCLVQASPCSIGFSGLESSKVSGATNLKVGNVRPSEGNVRYLITDPTNFQAYPLARKLYLNTMVGFDNVVDAEQAALAECFSDRAHVDPAATSAGFVTLPAGPVVCEDFNEQTQCGAASNNNACL